MDHEQWLEQHDRMMADFDVKQAVLQANQEKTERTLRRAIRLSIQDARRQRTRNAEFDLKMMQLAAAQVVTEEKLQGLIDALERGGNGKH